MGFQKAAEEIGGSIFEAAWREEMWPGDAGFDEAGLDKDWA